MAYDGDIKSLWSRAIVGVTGGDNVVWDCGYVSMNYVTAMCVVWYVCLCIDSGTPHSCLGSKSVILVGVPLKYRTPKIKIKPYF